MTAKSFYLYITIFLYLIISCAPSMEERKNEIIRLLDSAGEMYVPDKRIAVWNYEITDTSPSFSIYIESDLEKGLEFASHFLKDKFQEVTVKTRLLPDASLEEHIFGLINISTGNMRKSPKHSSELVNQELMGTPVKVLKKEDGWYLIQAPNGYIGWIDGPALSLKTLNEMHKMSTEQYIIYIKPYGRVYINPGSEDILSDLTLGNILKLTGTSGNYNQLIFPDGRIGYSERDGFREIASLQYHKKPDSASMVRFAKSFMGTSYLWGGKSIKAIDCSGFTAMIYFLHGIILQRDASQQIKHGKAILPGEQYANLKTGDLVFFGRKASGQKPERVTHVGMYIGDGEFIHASGLVRISSFFPNKDNYDPSYTRTFLGARRIIDAIGETGIEPVEKNPYYKFFFNRP